ncbi:MAG TPA: LON peptidase substrate-binding domain-containing protein [Saprospiraceae bacterium]|nr:LON peptidase substrate-binding domain-containing protein [Saprospiraceae bacterium]
MPESQKIPIFPLPIVVFPDEELRLHIFEPRYKQLIQDCRSQGVAFGIIPVIQNRMMDIGTLVRLDEVVKEYEDGRMDIKLSSLELFNVLEFFDTYSGKLYSAAAIQLIDHDSTENLERKQLVMSLFNELCEINHAKPYHPISWELFQSYKLGHYVGFTLEEEYRFCVLRTETERMDKLIQQLEYMIGNSKQRQEWLKRIHMNGEFKDFNIQDLK